MAYTKEEMAEVKDAFDKAYMEHKHEWPTKICGPNLVGVLNSAGFYQTKEWVGLTGVEINHIFAANVGYPERMMKEVENLLKEKNGG
jgi:hypothetical protein